MAKTSQELSSIGSVEVRGRLDFLKLFCKDLDSVNLAWIVFCLAAFFGSALTCLRINKPIGGEAHDGYIELARNLVSGNGYVFSPGGHKVFHRPPLYPSLLIPAALLSPFLCKIYVVLLNSALLAGSAGLLHSFAQRIFSSSIALIAVAILVLNPFLLYAVKNPMPPFCQMFFYLLLVVTTWFLLVACRSGRGPALKLWILYFTAMLCGVFCHGTMLAFSILTILGVGIYSLVRKNFFVFRGLIFSAIALAVCIAPWTLRNYRITGMFIPVVGNSGLAYFAGNAHWGITLPATQAKETRPESELRHIGLPPEKASELIRFYGFTSPQAEAYANAKTKTHLQNYPGDFLKKLALNGIEYYWPLFYYVRPPLGTSLAGLPVRERLRSTLGSDIIPLTFYNLVLVGLGLFGLFRLLGKNSEFFWKGAGLLIAWAAFACSYFPFLTFVGHSLYTFGTLPFVALLAAVQISAFFSSQT